MKTKRMNVVSRIALVSLMGVALAVAPLADAIAEKVTFKKTDTKKKKEVPKGKKVIGPINIKFVSETDKKGVEHCYVMLDDPSLGGGSCEIVNE